jgi:hypothetical protein
MKTIINKNVCIINNKNIFESIKQRVSAGNNGATVFVPHVCNNIDLFGAGFAGDVSKQFPTVKANYHMLGKSFLSKNMGYSQMVKVYEDPTYKNKLFFVNMIAQNGIKDRDNIRPLNYLGLVKAMNSLSSYIINNTGFLNKSEKIEIHCPKFGSGLAGGNWEFISHLIDDIWTNYSVSIYSINKNIIYQSLYNVK